MRLEISHQRIKKNLLHKVDCFNTISNQTINMSFLRKQLSQISQWAASTKELLGRTGSSMSIDNSPAVPRVHPVGRKTPLQRSQSLPAGHRHHFSSSTNSIRRKMLHRSRNNTSTSVDLVDTEDMEVSMEISAAFRH